MEMQKIDATGATGACPSFTISRESILPALDIIARQVVERRNTIPILSNVRIDVSPSGQIRLTGTDLDLELTATLSGECERPGATTVSAVTFRDIVKKAAKGSDIRCNASDGKMLVSSGRIKQSINTLPVDDFPTLQAMGQATLSGEFDAQALHSDLSRVSIAISTEETRYYLNGINVSIEGDLLCMAATDGHRLALVERPDSNLVSIGFQSGIIPRKAVKIALGLLKGSGPDPVVLDMSASKMSLDCGDIVLRSKLIDGTFPDYRRVIPNEAYLTGALSVESAELLQHCDAAKAQEGKVKALSVEIEAGSILAGVAGKAGYARPLSAEYDGTDCGLAFNATYMTDFAKLAPRLSLQTATFDGDRQGGAPILIHIEGIPEFTGVLMPVRWQDALPKPEPVRYVETIAAPGQAADLFAVERFGDKMATAKPGPRAATDKEQIAYLVDYAKRCGLPILEKRTLKAEGLTFGLLCDARTVYPTKADKWGYEHPDHSQPAVHHPAEYQEGAYSIPMPGRNQAPVTVEMMGDDGEYGAPMLCTDAKGRIALPDAPKARKGKAKAAKAVPPIEQPEPAATVSVEFEPTYRALPNGDYETSDAKGNIWLHRRNGTQELINDESGDAMEEARAYAKMMQEAADAFHAEFMPDMTGDSPFRQRLQAIADECNAQNLPPEPIQEQEATQATPEPEIAPQDEKIALPEPMEAESDPVAALIARLDALETVVATLQQAPSGEILDQPPLPDELKPKRSAAHVRAIMAYLAMRRERNAERKRVDERAHELQLARDGWKQSAGDATVYHSRLREMEHRRRRAVLKAREARKALSLSRDIAAERLKQIVEISAERSQAWQERDAIKAELSELKRKIADPTNPARESDWLMLKSNAESWQARATAAIAESERLKRLALQNAGHIETLASRIAKAESMLRDQGLWPALTVIEPPMPVAA